MQSLQLCLVLAKKNERRKPSKEESKKKSHPYSSHEQDKSDVDFKKYFYKEFLRHFLVIQVNY